MRTVITRLYKRDKLHSQMDFLVSNETFNSIPQTLNSRDLPLLLYLLIPPLYRKRPALGPRLCEDQ